MNIIPTESEIKTLASIGTMAIKTGFLPASIKTPEQAIIIALKGKELGIPPFQSFSQIAVVQGKPTISAELMLALIYKNVQSAEINFIKTDNEACVIKARRKKDSEFSEFKFTVDDAKKAGLMNKDNWNKYTAAMLRARAISAMARALFADAIAGASYTAEELGAEVNDDGEIVETKEIKKQVKKKEVPIEAEIVDDKLENALNYKLTFTKDSGKTLKQVLEEKGIKHIIDQTNKITEHFASKGKELDEVAKTYLDHASIIIENEMTKATL